MRFPKRDTSGEEPGLTASSSYMYSCPYPGSYRPLTSRPVLKYFEPPATFL